MARKGKRRRTRSKIVFRCVVLGTAALIGLFYYKPTRSYFSTKHELAQRSAEVHALDVENRALRRRLARSHTAPALIREARQLGWIRPGERLFIVKGIDRWRHQKHRKP